MTAQDKKPATRRPTLQNVMLVLIPPTIVEIGGVVLALMWKTEDGYLRAFRAALVSTAGPVAFLFQASLFVRILVAIGIVAIFVGLTKVTPLGRMKPHKLFLGSLIWCAIGFAAFVVQAID